MSCPRTAASPHRSASRQAILRRVRLGGRLPRRGQIYELAQLVYEATELREGTSPATKVLTSADGCEPSDTRSERWPEPDSATLRHPIADLAGNPPADLRVSWFHCNRQPADQQVLGSYIAMLGARSSQCSNCANFCSATGDGDSIVTSRPVNQSVNSGASFDSARSDRLAVDTSLSQHGARGTAESWTRAPRGRAATGNLRPMLARHPMTRTSSAEGACRGCRPVPGLGGPGHPDS